MKNLLYILSLLLLPLVGLGQEVTQEEPLKKENLTFKNQIDLDFEVLATGLSYKRRITDRIMVGAGLGLGCSVTFGVMKTEYRYEGYPTELYYEETGLESYRLGLIFEYEISKRFKYEFKSEIIGLTEVANFSTDMFFAIKNGVFVRLKGIELGADFVVGKEIYNSYGNDSWVYYIKPLNLKVPIKW